MNSLSEAPWESFKALLNLDYGAIEAAVEDHPGNYKDLDPRALYTDIADFYSIMHSSLVKGTWIDLGAGVGVSALMYSSLFPDRKSIAIESSHARVDAGREAQLRLNLNNTEFVEGDLLTCDIPEGETYFLYFPTGPVLDRILDQLRTKKKFKCLIAIESHGDLLPRLEKEKWLKRSTSLPLISQRHHPHAIIFERTSAPREWGPHQLSFQNKFLLIDNQWLGESFGLEWLKDNQYQLVHPPRTIEWNPGIKVMSRHELPRPVHILASLRRLGELEIKTHKTIYRASLRKILITPSLSVELSSGEWVLWDDISTISMDNKLCYESSSDYFFSALAPWEA